MAILPALFEQTGGFTMKLQPPELANVQCEVCHGYATGTPERWETNSDAQTGHGALCEAPYSVSRSGFPKEC